MLWPAKGRVRWSLGLGAAPTRAFSRAEVLGIPAPGKDSPSSALAPRRPPPKQPRPGSCNAGLGKWEQRPSGAVGGGGGRSVFFKPFPAFQA